MNNPSMLFTSLTDPLKRFRKPFLGFIKRLVYRGESPMQQMEQRYTREAAFSLKENLAASISEKNLTANRIDGIVADRRAALDKRLEPLVSVAEGNDALLGQFTILKNKILQSINAVKGQMDSLLSELNITNRSTAIEEKNYEDFQKLADTFFTSSRNAEQQAILASIRASQPPARPTSRPANPPVRPTSRPTGPQVIPPASAITNTPPPTTTPSRNPQAPARQNPNPPARTVNAPAGSLPTGRTERVNGQPVINEAFKDAQLARFQEMRTAWSGEGAEWIPDGGPLFNDGISVFARDFRYEILENFAARNTEYKNLKGQDAGYAFMEDLMSSTTSGGTSAMKILVQDAYRVFEAVGREKRDTYPSFNQLINTNRAAAYDQLRNEFFSQLTISPDATFKSDSDIIQRHIDQPPWLLRNIDIQGNAAPSGSEGTQETQEEAQETVTRFTEQFNTLKTRGISAKRFNHFLSRYKNEADITAQLTRALATPANQEVYLDAYDQGMAERFYIDQFMQHNISPQTLAILPQLYQQLQQAIVRGGINQERFTAALRNFGTRNYPRITMSLTYPAVPYFTNTQGGQAIRLNVSQALEGMIDGSAFGALRQGLDHLGENNILQLQQREYLDKASTFEQNASFLGFNSPNFMKETRTHDWNRIRGTQLPGTPSNTFAPFDETLAAYQIQLSEVKAGVSVQDVFDHAVQFIHLVESRRFRPQQRQVQSPLDYEFGGIKLRFDDSLPTGPAQEKYLRRMLIGSALPSADHQKKIAFAQHLLSVTQSKGLDLSPLMVINLLKNDWQPIDMDSDNNVFLTPLPSIDAMGSYLSIYKEKGNYHLKAFGNNRTDISIDNTIAEAYFATCRSRQSVLGGSAATS